MHAEPLLHFRCLRHLAAGSTLDSAANPVKKDVKMPACAGVANAQRVSAYTIDRRYQAVAAPSQRVRLLFVSVLHRKCSWEEGRRVERNSITNWVLPYLDSRAPNCSTHPVVPSQLYNGCAFTSGCSVEHLVPP